MGDKKDREQVEEVGELGQLRQELEACQEEAADWLDKYRRSAAEFSNYRKRQARERERQTLQLKMEMMRRLLPVIDDMERAIASIPEGVEKDGWVQGIKLIGNKFETFLDESRVVAIEALGEPFDPNFHSALMKAPSVKYPEGVVMKELEKGYLMDDQVLRPTRVQVSSGPRAEDEASADALG
jgi:molecular chaperone GrpE